ncbi:MAG: protein translocase subunit SecD, partial [Pseudomonadota bacterium]
MNKYPLWKYLLIAVVLAAGVFYAVPNLFGEYPAIQISPTRATTVDAVVLGRVQDALKRANITYRGGQLDATGAKIHFDDTETQIRARDLAQTELGDGFVVALNLLPATPGWLQALGARPMYLGLDLRGGVHFLMQVDMRSFLRKLEDSYADDMRRLMRENKVRYLTVTRGEGGVEIRFRDAAERDKARDVLKKELRDLNYTEFERGAELVIAGRLGEAAVVDKRRGALEQNMTSLSNRVNELGVAEPVIQQQGEDRIVVQLPGVQDTAKAKEILGRTATLEIMLVDEERDVVTAVSSGAPPGSKLYKMRDGRPILLKNRVIYSGDNIVDAAASFDSQTSRPIVSITLDGKGAAINQRVTGENVGKRMAVVYIEIKSEPRLDAQGRPVLNERGEPERVSRRVEEVITAPVIRSQLGKRFQIEGLESAREADELSLLLRAGSFAAPVEIIEERTVGPSLGQENIEQGWRAVLIGFIAVVVFMSIYYRMFGVIANFALLMNLVLLVAILSMLQATLTLPGIAG